MRPDYAYMNQVSLTTLSRGYLDDGITVDKLKDAAITRVNELIDRAEAILGIKLPTLRLGVKRGWVSPASPVWSNFGKARGLPISCNGSYMDDTIGSILMKTAEIGQMTKFGAGTSAYMGALRQANSGITGGGKSQGPVHFARLPQEQVTVISQANVRRGNCALWLDIEHGDADDWLNLRNEGHVIQHVSFGVVIGDQWMIEMLEEAKGGSKRKLMAKIINKRRATGYPYIMFRDAANEARHWRLKELDLKIWASNLCTEIMNHSTPDESFVCDLSSLNALHFDEWKDTNIVEEMVYFLDAVLTEYIDKIKALKFTDYDAYVLMGAALRFAERWRSIGLGILGYHSLLQSKMIPFASEEARALNIAIHKQLGEQSIAASRKMAVEYGEPEGMKGTGQRHVNVNAIAPTTSSSIILGQVSQSDEPWEAVVFENDNAKGVFTNYNPQFVELLEARGQNTPEVWTSIMQAGGRLDHLPFLSALEREVFKPWVDIDQTEIIRQAADRGAFIDQGQSLNLKIKPSVSMKENFDLLVLAWRSKLKSLYYHKSLNAAQELARQSCVACEA